MQRKVVQRVVTQLRQAEDRTTQAIATALEALQEQIDEVRVRAPAESAPPAKLTASEARVLLANARQSAVSDYCEAAYKIVAAHRADPSSVDPGDVLSLGDWGWARTLWHARHRQKVEDHDNG